MRKTFLSLFCLLALLSAGGCRPEALPNADKEYPLYTSFRAIPGVTAEETAARELLEEGGMVGEIGGYCGLREFVYKNKLYRVRYYAAKYISTDNPGEPNREPQWTSVAETRKILPYDDLKEVLDKCIGLIR
jgi:8-oxo-dGTP pyrophosphatase MutT (NUDIX family)